MLRNILLTIFLVLVAVAAIAEDIKVSDIQVQGNQRIETASILAAISIQPGDLVTLADVDRAMQEIFALGRFTDVKTEVTDIQGAKIITFVVQELPLVRTIEFVGNDELKREKLRPLVVLRIPSLYQRAKVEESVAAIKQAYIEDGYHAAKIEPRLETNAENEATLVFAIDEGNKVLIRDIN